MRLPVGTVITHPEAMVVVDYNKYKGIGRPRNGDYTTTVKHLFEEKTERTSTRIKKSQPVGKIVIEKTELTMSDKAILFLFILVVVPSIIGMIINH